MPEIVPHKVRCDAIAQMLTKDSFLKQLKMALPKVGVTPERIVRILITEVRKSERLSECTQISLMGALMQCAQYGLEPGPTGLAWIIPRRRKGTWEANFQLGYKGLCQLLWNSGKVSWINAQVVKQNDDFDYSLGAPPHVRFRPADRERGEITHVFGAIGTTMGGMTLEVWPIHQLHEHRERFVKAGEGTPWDTDPEAMYRKTLLIQAARFAPVSIEAMRAIAADEAVDRGMPQQAGFDVDLGDDEPATVDVEPEAAPAPAAAGAEGPEALLQLEAAIAARCEEFENPAKARTQVVQALQKEFGKLSELRGERLQQAIKAVQIVKIDVGGKS